LEYLARSTSGQASAAFSERLRYAAAHADDFVITHDGRRVDFSGVRSNPQMLSQQGRWTIRAPNGTGKSTLLIALAMHLAGRSGVYFLPAHSRMATEGGEPGSTGQIKDQHLADFDRNVAPNARVILLDEWNANLDPANRRRLSAMIERWSQRCAVIEVLNHEESGAAT
jgi:ABC-type cobalamin/Fe3+-siderophores transport system ATPase subunit